MISAGANINRTNNLGWTQLQFAVMNGKIDLVQKMIRYGADVNLVDTSGWSPLHEACANGLEVTKLLEEAGANLDQLLYPEAANSSPLDLACIHGFIDLAMSLVPHSHKIHQQWSGSELSVLHGDLEFLETHIDEIKKVDTNKVNHYGWTLLGLAVRHGHLELKQVIQQPQFNTVDTLIKMGANINHQNSPSGYTALHYLVKSRFTNEKLAIAKLLIDSGANLNLKNNMGKTVLDLCKTRTDRLPLIELLVAAGAK